MNKSTEMIKPNIALIMGGDSSEASVSMKSAQGIHPSIDKTKFNCFIVSVIGDKWVAKVADEDFIIDRNDFSFIRSEEKIKFDFAYITIHGSPGENGVLQGYFELLNIPYSTCGVLTSALTFDKFVCNQYLKSFGVKVAQSILLRRDSDVNIKEIKRSVGLPCFIKPNAGGSSFGITKVQTTSDIVSGIETAFLESDEVIIEQFIDGNEFTCGMYKVRDKEVVLPITEIISENDFFDFDAKYENLSQEITPARITDELKQDIQKLTADIYKILGCKGLIRNDYIVARSGEIFLIEVNTTPGMTETSLIPQQVKAAGLDLKAVVTDIIMGELAK